MGEHEWTIATRAMARAGRHRRVSLTGRGPRPPAPAPARTGPPYRSRPTVSDTTRLRGDPGSKATGTPFTRSGLRKAEPM